MGNYTIFRCSKILGEAAKQEILQEMFRNSRSQIVIRTDIFWKLSLGAPGFWAVFDTKLKQFVFKYVMLMTSRFSWAAKALFTFRNWFLNVESTFLQHSYSLNVSLVLLCDSFDVLTSFILFLIRIVIG